jgi:hypothetical protein
MLSVAIRCGCGPIVRHSLFFELRTGNAQCEALVMIMVHFSGQPIPILKMGWSIATCRTYPTSKNKLHELAEAICEFFDALEKSGVFACLLSSEIKDKANHIAIWVDKKGSKKDMRKQGLLIHLHPHLKDARIGKVQPDKIDRLVGNCKIN